MGVLGMSLWSWAWFSAGWFLCAKAGPYIDGHLADVRASRAVVKMRVAEQNSRRGA